VGQAREDSYLGGPYVPEAEMFLTCADRDTLADLFDGIAAGLTAVAALNSAGAGAVTLIASLACPPCAAAFGAAALGTGVAAGLAWWAEWLVKHMNCTATLQDYQRPSEQALSIDRRLGSAGLDRRAVAAR
jgi:hypothetical protein